MNFKISCTLLFLIACSVMLAQVNYTISPNKSINLNVVLNQTTASKIYQVNTSNTKVLLKWERILVNLPASWVHTTCDYGSCYGGTPAGPITMDSIPVGGQGLLGLDIDPGNVLGTGMIKVLVYQNGYRSSGDTLTWNITSSAVGINELTDESGIKVYPNPASDVLNINFTNGVSISSAYVIDPLGRKVKQIAFSGINNSVNVSDLNAGYYNLIVETKSGLLFKKIVKN
jgi:hypothetical protein